MGEKRKNAERRGRKTWQKDEKETAAFSWVFRFIPALILPPVRGTEGKLAIISDRFDYLSRQPTVWL